MPLTDMAKNAQATVVGDMLDGGLLRLLSATGTSLAELRFGSPAFGTPNGGTLRALPLSPDEHAAGGGEAKTYELVKADGSTVVGTGRVGTNPDDAELVLLDCEISPFMKVSISSFVLEPRNG